MVFLSYILTVNAMNYQTLRPTDTSLYQPGRLNLLF
jgi:hypothetical protein